MRPNKLPKKQSRQRLCRVWLQTALETNNRCSFCNRMKMLMNANSEGCCTNSICPLGGKRMGSTSLCLSLFLLISWERWFPDPCVCCFVTSQTVIIPFVSLLHCCSTHNKRVCRPVWIMMERFWLSYLALVKQQAGRAALPPHGFYRRHRCACYSRRADLTFTLQKHNAQAFTYMELGPADSHL